VFIVFAHHEMKSFNGALYRTAVKALEDAGHEVKTSELYQMKFDPVSDRRNSKSVENPDYLKQQMEEMKASKENAFSDDIEAEIKKMEWCDIMIWQFPLWWFGLPGILKGWADKCFAMGRTYGGGRAYATGMFRGKKAVLSLTSGGPAHVYVQGGFNGDLAGILRPIHRGIFEFCGFDVLTPQAFYMPARASDEDRAKMLASWASRLATIGAEEGFEVGHYK